MTLLDQARFLLTYREGLTERQVWEVRTKQQALMQHTEQAWNRFLPWFKQRCREFCNGVEPGFEPLLQKLLLGEHWTFHTWEEIFYSDSRSILCQRDPWYGDKVPFVISKIIILMNPEQYVQNLFHQVYAIYQKLPRTSAQGLFDVEITWKELFEYIAGAREFSIDRHLPNFWNLERSAWQNQVLHKNKQYLRPELGLEEKNLLLIKNTPWEVCIPKKSKIDLPEKPRLAHQWIIGASGAGKTQLLQRMICDDIEHGRSVVVMDSQRDMIGKLVRLKHNMEVVFIDPEDIEYPPGIALFDIQFGSGAEAEARETQVIELYEYMFSVFGAELTARQGSLFTYALRLMFVIPKSNIHTLVDLFRSDKNKYRQYFSKMDSVEKEFFEQEFFEPKYRANRDQILAKLNKILENKTLRRIFSNTQSKLDFFSLLNRPVAIFINTSQEQLGEKGCALFGRFLLSLLTNAIVGRSKIPEEQRRSVYLYVDEGRDYGNDDAFDRIIYQCRKYAAGLIFCSQNIGQLAVKTVAALFTASIKFVRAVKEPQETRKLAQSIRVEENFLHDLEIKDRSHAEWACQIENQKTVKARVDFGYLESQPKITEAEYQKFREENRRKHCVKASEGDEKPAIKEEVAEKVDSPKVKEKEILRARAEVSGKPKRNKPKEDDDYFA